MMGQKELSGGKSREYPTELVMTLSVTVLCAGFNIFYMQFL